MDFSRIARVINVDMMLTKCVAVVGVGGAANLCRNLVRCGVGRLKIVDNDTVGPENVSRQEQFPDQIGMPKVDAVAPELKRINPDLCVETFERDFCSFTDAEIDEHFGESDLFVLAVDNLAANARGNEIALRLNKPAVWVGLYPEGRAGEVIFWRQGLDCCYRCMVPGRYEAFANGTAKPMPSDGADIFAVQHLDSIAGMVCLGLLTAGSDNRYGKLIQNLGNRQFLQVKIDPDWTIGGVDPVRKYLGVPEGADTYFSFCTVVRRDPDGGIMPCPDCEKYRGHKFVPGTRGAGPLRLVPLGAAKANAHEFAQPPVI